MLGQDKLGFGGEVALVFEDEDEISVQCVVNRVEGGVCLVNIGYLFSIVGWHTGEVLEVNIVHYRTEFDVGAWRRRQWANVDGHLG